MWHEDVEKLDSMIDVAVKRAREEPCTVFTMHSAGLIRHQVHGATDLTKHAIKARKGLTGLSMSFGW